MQFPQNADRQLRSGFNKVYKYIMWTRKSGSYLLKRREEPKYMLKSIKLMFVEFVIMHSSLKYTSR